MANGRLAVATGLAMILGACSNSAEVRYKVTVEVDDNGTHRTGSSVMSFALSKPTVALVSPYDAKFRGEAVLVDLGGDRTLFALLVDEEGDGAGIRMLPERLFKDLSSGSERVRNIKDIADNEGLVREVPRFWPAISDSREPMVQYPLLVRFRSPDQPESIEAVAPDALDQAFGPGVRLKRITAEITDAPVTDGIKRHLPWLEEVGRVRGTLIPNPPRFLRDTTPIQRVHPSDFTTELYK
jgi:hypothetical protein